MNTKVVTLPGQSTSTLGMHWNHISSILQDKAKQSLYSIANTVPTEHQDCIVLTVIDLLLRALHLRNRDRHINMHQYPKLHYPEIYILQGGYSGFFAHFKERCEPQNYVAMQDERHKATCAIGMRNFGKGAKLIRTQSFTYGINAATSTTNNNCFMGMGGAVSSTTTIEQQDDDDTMNTEDDTFEGIESRITGTNSGHRRVPSTTRTSFTARRAVSY
jgi:hypothetical protein